MKYKIYLINPIFSINSGFSIGNIHESTQLNSRYLLLIALSFKLSFKLIPTY